MAKKRCKDDWHWPMGDMKPLLWGVEDNLMPNYQIRVQDIERRLAWKSDTKIELRFTLRYLPPSHREMVQEAMTHFGEPKAHVHWAATAYSPIIEFDISVGERVWLPNDATMPQSATWLEVTRQS